jgi:predicted PurR-regulated permease PerM
MERRREQVLGLLWWAAMAGVSWLVLRYALVWLLPFLLALGAAALLEPLELAGEETLRLGTATLKFVPFCGPDFSW